ncbi:MAG: L-serine ammonia-lyase [Myxococcota bacterium]
MSFISVFDLFKVGVGPSSSHTMGPMVAGRSFIESLGPALNEVDRVEARLVGSLAHTGRGHHTDQAVLWGLSGLRAEDLQPARAQAVLEAAYTRSELVLGGQRPIRFETARDLVFDCEAEVSIHPNELRFLAFDKAGALLGEGTYFSIGGGFIATHDELVREVVASIEVPVPFPFKSGAELLAQAKDSGLSIAALVAANELEVRSEAKLHAGLARIGQVMNDCIDRGLRTEGILPGGLEVRRRASTLMRRLEDRSPEDPAGPVTHMDYVHLWAMAVNEENAAGGQVVTAPTNGAAGIVPAVLRYHFTRLELAEAQGRQATRDYLLTASAIGSLFKRNASISGAEVGCQGEVGAASSMAAGGLCALMGGSPAQIENAAEIAIEHSLGLTCDPIGGLVQVPCIERNGFGAVKAIGAARLALLGDGSHRVSLDQAISTMRQTGFDMHAKYKETALGGLAVTFVEC